MDDYRIKGTTLTLIANQVRRLGGVEELITPAEMAETLEMVEIPKLTAAEESLFGTEKSFAGYGFDESVTFGSTAGTTSRTFGWKFTAAESFAISGLRLNGNGTGGNAHLYIWDENGEVVKTATVNNTYGWIDILFDTPLIVNSGETYTVGGSGVTIKCATITDVSFASVLLNTSALWVNGTDLYPTGSTTNLVAINIIIEPVAVILPDDYQVKRTTMDDIAEEVQRISGATTKLSTAQIIAGLSEVEVLEDYEEVTF